MSYGQAFLLLATVAAGSVAVLVGAQTRWRERGLVAAAGALFVLAEAALASRALAAGVPARHLVVPATPVLGAFVAGALVVHLRRRSAGVLVTGLLAWLAVLGVYFEGFYLLLRP